MKSFHDRRALDAYGRRRGLDPHRIRSLRTRFYKRAGAAVDVLAALPTGEQLSFARHFRLHSLRLLGRRESSLDGAGKLLWATERGERFESVILRIASGRCSLCVSCQVGCAAGCVFCATGRLGLHRNLEPEQILDQVAGAARLLRGEGRRVRNLVFMGMGEPFHNRAHLCAALDVLLDPACFHWPARRIMVSTVGVPQAMVEFAERYPGVNLALSLHSADQTVRQRLIPLARGADLCALRAALVQVNRIQRRAVMIEYLLLKDINDDRQDARALAAYLGGLDVHVNLIPFNRFADAGDLVASPPVRQQVFARCLREQGLVVTARHSLGADIGAACGQLARAGVAAT